MLNTIKKAIETGDDKETVKVLLTSLIARNKSESLLLDGTIDLLEEYTPENKIVITMLAGIKQELEATREELRKLRGAM